MAKRELGAAAGYSGTPLWRKLGIGPGSSVALVGVPEGMERAFAGLPKDASVRRDLRVAELDVVVLSCARAAELHARFPAAARKLAPSGGLWVAWPKKSAGVATDLSDAVVRAYGLSQGLADNKVCAIDTTWSGLRFVVRRADRPARAR